MILTVAGITFLIYRYMLRNALAVERVRNRIALDLHDELGGLVTGIALSADMMEFESTQGKDTQRKKIISLSRDAIGKLGDVVWSINSGNDNFGSLRDRIQESMDAILSASPLVYELKIEGLADDQMIPADVRQNIYLICKEATNNAAKYANGDSFIISLSNTSGGFVIHIIDNGTAANGSKKTGHGLGSMEKRARQLGGTLTIKQESNGFALTVNLSKKL